MILIEVLLKKYPNETIIKAIESCNKNNRGKFNLNILFNSFFLNKTITKQEINVDIEAAYNPMNFIKHKFTKKLTHAPITVVFPIIVDFLKAVKIPPYNEATELKKIATNSIYI